MAHLEGSDNVLVSHDVRLAGNGDGESVFDCARHFEAARDPFVSYFLRGYIATSTVVARRKALIAAGGFDEHLASGQDYEMWLRLISAPGARFHVFAGALTRNLRHGKQYQQPHRPPPPVRDELSSAATPAGSGATGGIPLYARAAARLHHSRPGGDGTFHAPAIPAGGTGLRGVPCRARFGGVGVRQPPTAVRQNPALHLTK